MVIVAPGAWPPEILASGRDPSPAFARRLEFDHTVFAVDTMPLALDLSHRNDGIDGSGPTAVHAGEGRSTDGDFLGLRITR
jgi:hypothetical protein